MSIYKKIGLYFIGLILFICVSILLNIVPVLIFFNSQDQVVSIIESSDIATELPQSLANSAANESSAEEQTTNKFLLETYAAALPTDQVNDEIVRNIEQLYTWIEGETDTPSFGYDFSDNSGTVRDSFREAIANELKNAPVCTGEQNSKPLENKCIPQGYTTESFIESQIGSDDEELKAVMKVESAPINQETSERIQTGARIIKSLPFIVLLVGTCCIALILYISRPNPKGIKIVASNFLHAGLLSLFGWGLAYEFTLISKLFGMVIASMFGLSNTQGVVDSFAQPESSLGLTIFLITKEIVQKIAFLGIVYSAVALVIAIVLFLVYRQLKLQQSTIKEKQNYNGT